MFCTTEARVLHVTLTSEQKRTVSRLHALIFSCPFFACRNFSFRSRGGSAAGLKSSSSCVYERGITSSHPTLFLLTLCSIFLHLSLSFILSLLTPFPYQIPFVCRLSQDHYTLHSPSLCPFLLLKSLSCLLNFTFQLFFHPKS